MRSAIHNSQKQIKTRNIQQKNSTQNVLNSTNQQIIKVVNLSAKLSSRSPINKPHSLILQSKPAKNAKSSANKPNVQSKVDLKQQASSSSKSRHHPDSSRIMTDENTDSNPDVINALRVSSRQRPSKVVIEQERFPEPSTKRFKGRHHSMVNDTFTRPSHNGLVQIPEEQFKNLPTTANGRIQQGCRQSQVNNIQWDEVQKMCIEEQGDISPKSLQKSNFTTINQDNHTLITKLLQNHAQKNQKASEETSTNTTSTKSTSSPHSIRQAIDIKMFDAQLDSTYVSPSNNTPIFECEEEVFTFNKKEQITDLNCEEIINLDFMKNESKMEIEAELTPEQEIKNFEQNLIHNEIYVDIFHNMIANEQDYSPDPFYFKLKQRELNNLMRSILVDWMIDVSSEFFLKRETFHTALNYVDRYLSIVPNIKKWDLQLLGLTSLFVASKMEVNFIYLYSVIHFIYRKYIHIKSKISQNQLIMVIKFKKYSIWNSK